MSTFSTPTWRAARNGTLNQSDTAISSTQINQFLGTHPSSVIYQGNSILTPNGTGIAPWGQQLSTQDVDQPFTMSGTTIGRIQVPVIACGNGADLMVSLMNDNGSGQPGTLIAQTRLPASWIQQFGAVSAISAPAASTPTIQYTNNPLAVAQFNTLHMGNYNTRNWSYPSTQSGGPSTAPCSTSYGPYFIQIGGSSGATIFNSVYTIPFDTLGNLQQAQLQPSIPVATDGTSSAVVAVESNGNVTIVLMGGQTASGVYSSNVFAAGFDVTTGTVAAWNTQTSLPYTNNLFGAAAYGPYVYMVGGYAGTYKNAVYYATVSNGQINQWSQTSSLPILQAETYVVACDGFLFAFGGYGTASAALNTAYYAPIESNGSLGEWVQMGNIPVATSLFNGNANQSAGTYGVIGNGGGSLLLLGVSPNGPDVLWRGSNFSVGGDYYAVYNVSDGTWIYYGIYTSSYTYVNVSIMPMISVPMAVTGLTSGTKYHVLLQQIGGDTGDYLILQQDFDAFPGNPTGLVSNRNAYSWSTMISTGHCIPIQIYDYTTAGAGWPPALPIHTRENGGAKITTLVERTTPDSSFIGVAEAVQFNEALNQNPGFQYGITPWTAVNGTVVQSSTEAFNSNYSAQVTPNGTSASCTLLSELLECLPGQSITVTCLVWVTTAVTSNFSLSIEWFTAGGVATTTTSTLISVPAQTWTSVTNVVTAPTTGTLPYRFAIAPTLSGTPAASNIWYVDDVYAYYTTVSTQLSTVTEVSWTGYWPESVYPPTGTTQLA